MPSITTISTVFSEHLTSAAALVELKSPMDEANQNTSLWLYQVTLDEHSRNCSAPLLQESTAVNSARKKGIVPLGVNLQFLVTPMRSNINANYDELTRLFVAINDASILHVPKLTGGHDSLRISILTESLEDRFRIWDSFKNKAYRISFSCILRTAILDSDRVVDEFPVSGFESVDVGTLTVGAGT